MKRRIRSISISIVAGLLFSAFGLMVSPEGFCQPVAFSFKLDSGVQITKAGYDIKYWKPAKKAALQVEVMIKNISETPTRYKVTVKAEGAPYPAAALVPRKGKPPRLDPQKEEATVLPLYTDKAPKHVSVTVEKAE